MQPSFSQRDRAEPMAKGVPKPPAFIQHAVGAAVPIGPVPIYAALARSSVISTMVRPGTRHLGHHGDCHTKADQANAGRAKASADSP